MTIASQEVVNGWSSLWNPGAKTLAGIQGETPSGVLMSFLCQTCEIIDLKALFLESISIFIWGRHTAEVHGYIKHKP